MTDSLRPLALCYFAPLPSDRHFPSLYPLNLPPPWSHPLVIWQPSVLVTISVFDAFQFVSIAAKSRGECEFFIVYSWVAASRPHFLMRSMHATLIKVRKVVLLLLLLPHDLVHKQNLKRKKCNANLPIDYRKFRMALNSIDCSINKIIVESARWMDVFFMSVKLINHSAIFPLDLKKETCGLS